MPRVDAPGASPVPFTSAYEYLYGCKLDRDCEWNAVLELELQDAIAGDVVEVDWKAIASAYVVDTSDLPTGVTVSVSEP